MNDKLPLLPLSVELETRSVLKKLTQANRALAVRDDHAWEEWILYLLEGIVQTSNQTISLIKGIRGLMLEFKHRIRKESPKSYSHEFLNILFTHPYSKISFVEQGLGVSRVTATHRLNELVRLELMEKLKKGRDIYYINTQLFELLANVNDD